MTPLISILTPAIWDRVEQAKALAEKITTQAEAFAGQVEHVVVFDNRAVPIGLKRQACFDSSHGKYITFCDDDDDISGDYVANLIAAAELNPDVITFQEIATVDDQKSHITMSMKNKDGPFTPDGQTIRSAWHVCAWKRELVKDCTFPAINYGEDIAWCMQARMRVKNELHIPRVLHYYRHNSKTTAAPFEG